ncbi:DUF2971 domain-containing protein [Salinisphaera sp. P385]|uniref:DUF2971 domain-containing protein n=1 Tax=Spectribacter acetivorans TaxID=3075603 RepID=A0ABU3B779_9GAMM|nr:DUF2971 domain-containing protein [Salinisphaera sp. P385]MDT0618312.1 DUF2971 domain-containing protein [Salinisphaera sp. P385]
MAGRMPEKLYKYYSISDRSLKAVKDQAIYFSPPNKFNDPFDSAVMAPIAEPSPQEKLELHTRLKHERSSEDPFPDDLHLLTPEDAWICVKKVVEDVRDDFRSRFLNLRGVACFSEVNDSILMWSHYARAHTGFCLEFNTSGDLFSKARRVEYKNSFPELSVNELLLKQNAEHLIDLSCTKHESWAYEREWRLIHRDGGTVYNYSAEELTGVYFGSNIDSSFLEIICLILRGQNEHIKFYYGGMDSSSFSVNFREVGYCSHLEKSRMES